MLDKLIKSMNVSPAEKALRGNVREVYGNYYATRNAFLNQALDDEIAIDGKTVAMDSRRVNKKIREFALILDELKEQESKCGKAEALRDLEDIDQRLTEYRAIQEMWDAGQVAKVLASITDKRDAIKAEKDNYEIWLAGSEERIAELQPALEALDAARKEREEIRGVLEEIDVRIAQFESVGDDEHAASAKEERDAVSSQLDEVNGRIDASAEKEIVELGQEKKYVLKGLRSLSINIEVYESLLSVRKEDVFEVLISKIAELERAREDVLSKLRLIDEKVISHMEIAIREKAKKVKRAIKEKKEAIAAFERTIEGLDVEQDQLEIEEARKKIELLLEGGEIEEKQAAIAAVVRRVEQLDAEQDKAEIKEAVKKLELLHEEIKDAEGRSDVESQRELEERIKAYKALAKLLQSMGEQENSLAELIEDRISEITENEKLPISSRSLLSSSRIQDAYLTMLRKQGYSNSKAVNRERAVFFSGIYGVEIKEATEQFSRLMGDYEFHLVHAVMPSEREITDICKGAFGAQQGIGTPYAVSAMKTITANMRGFYGISARFSPVWVFDATCDLIFRNEKVREIRRDLRALKEFLVNLYERLCVLQISEDAVLAREEEHSAMDCLGSCLFHCLRDSPGVALIKQLMEVHIARIQDELEDIETKFDELLAAYNREIVAKVKAKQASMVLLRRGGELGDMSMTEPAESAPLLGGGNGGGYAATERMF